MLAIPPEIFPGIKTVGKNVPDWIAVAVNRLVSYLISRSAPVALAPWVFMVTATTKVFPTLGVAFVVESDRLTPAAPILVLCGLWAK